MKKTPYEVGRDAFQNGEEQQCPYGQYDEDTAAFDQWTARYEDAEKQSINDGEGAYRAHQAGYSYACGYHD